MFSSCFFMIYFFVGSFGEHQANRNINRVSATRGNYLQRQRNHWALDNNIIQNDYDDHSSRLSGVQPPMHILYPSEKTSSSDDEKIPIKVHNPREDPKLFYQSEAYLKESIGQNVNYEVTAIYPERDVVRTGSKFRIPKHLLRSRNENDYVYPKPKLCIQCPYDKTLVAKLGADKVFLQNSVLKTCSGRRAPENVHFVHMYGPKFGTLLQQGSHVIVGRIMHNNNNLRLCKIQVHVILQSCPTPKYLISHCGDRSQPCNFTCRDESLELQGESALICGEDMKWERDSLPTCRARNWCKPLPAPETGRISCRGGTAGRTAGLTEGTRCRIRCPLGWQWHPKSVTVCRRGTWTNILTCIQKDV